MAEPLDPNDLVTLEELAIANRCELGTLVRIRVLGHTSTQVPFQFVNYRWSSSHTKPL